jgi:hypothetical protein
MGETEKRGYSASVEAGTGWAFNGFVLFFLDTVFFLIAFCRDVTGHVPTKVLFYDTL